MIFFQCCSVFFLLGSHMGSTRWFNNLLAMFNFLSVFLFQFWNFLCHFELSFVSIVFKNAETLLPFALLLTFTQRSLKPSAASSNLYGFRPFHPFHWTKNMGLAYFFWLWKINPQHSTRRIISGGLF